MLARLQLSQFRCFEALRLDLEAGASLFVGDNAQGKTSVLEAVCVLLRLQSPRTSSLSDAVRFGGEGFALSGVLGEAELQYRQRTRGRELRVDGERQARSGDYLRASDLVVWMANDDLQLIRGGGDGRRRFLDFMATQMFPTYRPALKAYERALRSRNFLLKRDKVPQWDQVDAYTALLVEHGALLTRLRRELVERLAPLADHAQGSVSGRGEGLGLVYRPASGEEDDLAQTLMARRDEELRRRQTVAGPHRDDLELSVDGKPAARFASEGQQRTAALALKLAQSRLFLEWREQPPLLLIDDVFGELDPGRRNALMSAWPEGSQKLITTTHLDWLDASLGPSRTFQVSGHRVSEESSA